MQESWAWWLSYARGNTAQPLSVPLGGLLVKQVAPATVDAAYKAGVYFSG